jgi:hypothetical protein
MRDGCILLTSAGTLTVPYLLTKSQKYISNGFINNLHHDSHLALTPVLVRRKEMSVSLDYEQDAQKYQSAIRTTVLYVVHDKSKDRIIRLKKSPS